MIKSHLLSAIGTSYAILFVIMIGIEPIICHKTTMNVRVERNQSLASSARSVDQLRLMIIFFDQCMGFEPMSPPDKSSVLDPYTNKDFSRYEELNISAKIQNSKFIQRQSSMNCRSL